MANGVLNGVKIELW